jgi:hypothetical protein
MHVTVLRFGVAVGAPELLRGRTVAQKIVLVAVSNCYCLQLCTAGCRQATACSCDIAPQSREAARCVSIALRGPRQRAKATPAPRTPASAGTHRGACLPRADCPFAPAARAQASSLCCFVWRTGLVLDMMDSDITLCVPNTVHRKIH